MSTINNLSAYDPFADTGSLEDSGKNKAEYIHIRIQQRNGRKTLTTLQGLPKEFDQKRLLKHFKRNLLAMVTLSKMKRWEKLFNCKVTSVSRYKISL
ncbi:Eukaryotic translation initiation factor eIF-1 [Entomophthora muscae]|uniref:Eukaryotic translation initiation factor eIF-1 n=1 Tax=Entomophthora muscae TaxID=34485 RepID=A0ACC2UH83_9FUNG|nr:Eukaryotic translation initiation factor eIF-1 [Entomophthora muscae]